MADPTGDPAEDIQNDNIVSRPFFKIPTEVDPRSLLRFDFDRIRDERAMSVVWRKYAPNTDDVHDCGRAIVAEVNETVRSRGGELEEYSGFRSAVVSAVRAIKGQRGHGLNVVHVPLPGKRWHAHISVVPTPGQRAQKVSATVRGELRELLYAALGPYETHNNSLDPN